MADRNRRAGTIEFYVDGKLYDAKQLTYDLGGVTREAIVGADRVHGFKETVRPASCEGAITDAADLDLAKLYGTTNTTVMIVAGNRKTYVLRNAWFAGESKITTEEGEIAVRFEGLSAEELSA